MLEIKKLGKAKSIGVCNYNISHIEEIKSAGLPLPEANQIEIHPWCQKTELASYLKQNNISIIDFIMCPSNSFLLNNIITIMKSRCINNMNRHPINMDSFF